MIKRKVVRLLYGVQVSMTSSQYLRKRRILFVPFNFFIKGKYGGKTIKLSVYT